MLIITLYDIEQDDGEVEDRFKVFYKDGPEDEAEDVTSQYSVAACTTEDDKKGFVVIKNGS
jgi:hypothetical protein